MEVFEFSVFSENEPAAQIPPDAYCYVLVPVRQETLTRFIRNSGRQEEPARNEGRRNAIIRLCLRIGIPAQIQGFQYIVEAVDMLQDRPQLIHRITQGLYPGIAERHQTNASKVERSIRHAVGIAWDRDQYTVINELYGFTVCHKDKKPSNSEFIALLFNICRNA